MMKKSLLTIIFSILFFTNFHTVSAQFILQGPQGGTNIGSGGTVGHCLKISSTGPLVWTTGTCGSGGGSGGDSVFTRDSTTGLIYHPTTTDDVRLGGTSTSTRAKLEVGFTLANNGSLTALGSTTLQNVTFKLATGTSATTTNSFSTTASSTNLFGQLINGFGLSSCTTTNALTWTGGSFSCTAQPQGTVTSVSGTSNRISSTGGATPVIDIDAAYVGQSSITTLGTISTGVWNGTAIANANLAFSTISGIALGSNLADLTATNGTLTFSGTYNGGTARTIGLNLGNANVWTASTTFVGGLNSINSTSTNATSTNLYVSNDFWLNASRFSSLTGTGLTNTGGVLTNSGVTSIVAGQNINISGATGAVTVNASNMGNSKWATTSTYINPNVSGTGIYVISASSTITNLSMINSTSTNATSTNFAVTNITQTGQATGCATYTSGVLTSTGVACGSGSGGASIGEAWSFYNAKAYLAPTTTVGIVVNASSTIGSGAQAGGLTILGGATTTGNALISGALTVTGDIISSTGSLSAGGGAIGIATLNSNTLQIQSAKTISFSGGPTTISNATSTIGSGAQAGGLTIFGGATTTGNQYIAGNLGVATITPATAVDINGYVKVLQTSTTTACSAAIQGSMFYNQANGIFWGCGAASTWTQFGAGTAGAGGTNFFTNSGASTYLSTGSNLGVGTSTPYAMLSVAGQVVANNFFATSTTATSSFAGGLTVGNGAIVYDLNTGTTTINQLDLGNLSFAPDSGIINALDFPLQNAALNTKEAQLFGFNLSSTTPGYALFSLFAQSNGGGATKNEGVGIGTTSPTSLFTVGTSTNSTATTTIFFDSNKNVGTCIVLKDTGTGNGYTYGYALTGNVTWSTKDCRTAN